MNGTARSFTPEEESIGDPDDGEDDEADPLTPADLWYRGMCVTAVEANYCYFSKSSC